jgi:uncharacterized protein (TIGR03083 family)
MSGRAAVGELTATERLAFVHLLVGLTPEQWATPSLCSAWTVQEVAAHLAWAPVVSIPEAMAGMLRSGFRLNTFIADSAKRWSQRGPAAILAQLRENAERGARPPGMPEVAALADAVVHGLDVRRPLDRPRAIPPAAFAPVADFFAGASWVQTLPIAGSPRRTVAGLRLVADDLDWAHGEGPEVRGHAEALMLLLAGRPVGAAELTGPGAEQLYARLVR